MDTEGMGHSRVTVSRGGGCAHAAWETHKAASKRKRILLVDDNRDVLGVISKILSRLGYEVVPASNGIEGFALHVEDPCEFVLTDLDMPVMDGLSLARRIKAEYPLIPVVIMTGTTSAEGDFSHAMAKSFVDEVLYKPIRLVDLQRTVQKLLS